MRITSYELEKIGKTPVIKKLVLTAEELAFRTDIKDASPIHIELTGKADDTSYRLHIKISGDLLLLDAHDATFKKFHYTSSDDVFLSNSDDEEIISDIELVNNEYDFQGEILALFYDAVPLVYYEEEMKKFDIAGCRLISEEEYAEEKLKASPLSSLSNLEIDEE